MKIKTIEILGFKSFFDKTSLTFLPGITAMVGPNGCGKSNIVDAIRWAMGEQSAKHLRGNMMEDVIFNGSRSKKPLGMAEVSLTFANDNGNAPALYREFSEIQVTRRLFRSGESEYYINKAPCRLKDITELFLDTGVGTKAYSIIEQGRVETIISAKPLDLRILIEEAAGISKYKARKQEALRKMEATRQNLLRVNDVLGEIKKQIGSLAYQAQKLKRFKGLKDRIRTLELALASQKYLGLSENHALRETELEAQKDTSSLLLTEVNSLEAEILSRRTHVQHCEEGYSATQRKMLEVSYSIREEENTVTQRKERLGDIEASGRKAEQEIQENLRRLQIEEEEIRRSRDLRNNLQGQISEFENTLKEDEGALSELKQHLSAIQKDLESAREELFDIRYERGRRENLINYAEKTRVECKQRLDQSKQEGQTANAQQDNAKRQVAELSEALEKSQGEISLLENEQASHEYAISLLKEELAHATASIADMKEQQARQDSHLQSLKELCRSFEGCSEGVRAIMQRKKELEGNRNGIHGLLADFIETEPRLEKALEAVLGEKLQYIIVKSQDEGVEAIEYLKSQALGRGSFVPLQSQKVFPFQDQTLCCPEDYGVPLITKVKSKDECLPIVRYLLGDTLLVKNMAEALELWKRNDFRAPLVTAEGEIVDPMGILTGGMQNGSGAGYLSKKREIKELEQHLVSLAHDLLTLQATKAERAAQLEEKEKSLKQVLDLVVKQRLSQQGLEKDLNHLQEETQRIQRKLEFLALEEEKLTGELAELEKDLASNRLHLNEMESNEVLLEESYSVLRGKERDHQEKIELREARFDRSKNSFMEVKAQLSSVVSTLTLREKAVLYCQTEIEKYERAREEAAKESSSLQQGIETASARIHELSQAYQALQDELRGQEQLLDEERDRLKSLEEKLKVTQKELNEIQFSLQALTHDISEITSKLRGLEEAMMGKHHVLLSEVATHYPAEQYPEEEVSTKLEKLERAREKMIEGINFNAEREYQEHVEKYEFYQAQADDLNKALHSLQEAISKINHTSRERFQTAFEKINENFREIVPLIYEGGNGELRMTDSDDLLETGVEIMVQPAGKSLKSITLLSGGEKALAAISLLFALFLFKPTPFCLLDEIDSPLDDANVDRFVTMLRRFGNNSQFILITHNKKTMETADVLYGITMEEPGVSKTVSVRLN